MIKKTFLVFILVLFLCTNCLSSFCYATQLPDTNRIDEFVLAYLKENGLPGASIAVVTENGEAVYMNGYGHDSNGEPLTENSPIRLASGSKPFTAFAVLQLVDDGKIKLDESVVSYLPEFTIDDSRWEQVTARQLLSHTSGLPSPIIIPPANTLDARVESLRGWNLQSQPGEKYAYSNANYWLLAYLVEEISGTEFPDYLQQKIFIPLGMNNSLSAINTGDNVEGLANGHVSTYGKALAWTELEQMFCGAGGVVSTAEDISKWLSMHLNNGKNKAGEQLLSEGLLREAYTPQARSERYGLGWQLSSPGVSPVRVAHSGVLSTYESRQDIVLSGGYAVAVMLNCFTTTKEQAHEISSGIIQVIEGNTPDTGSPTPKIIDLSLGLVTLLYLVLGIRGIIRSRRWSKKRNSYPSWKFYLRQIPQLAPAMAIGWLFFIVPILENNSSTIKDVFGLWPAAMLLLAIIGIIGFVLITMRIYYRIKSCEN